MLKCFCLAAFFSSPAFAEGEKAGDFDYYVLALSWNATWCELEGDAREAEQCDPRFDYGFTLHGLWPQYDTGWPSFCRSDARNPSRAQTSAMSDIMASGGLAFFQWKKHGRCTGLSSTGYFAAARTAYEAVSRPQTLREIPREMSLPPKVVEAAFLEVNPNLQADGVTITCKGGYIQEVRICLSKDLEPRQCGADVVRDCTLDTARMPMMR